jgi:hypothetical protein
MSLVRHAALQVESDLEGFGADQRGRQLFRFNIDFVRRRALLLKLALSRVGYINAAAAAAARQRRAWVAGPTGGEGRRRFEPPSLGLVYAAVEKAEDTSESWKSEVEV